MERMLAIIKHKAYYGVRMFGIVISSILLSCSSIRTSGDPDGSLFINSDIPHFYTALDVAEQDTTKAEAIFKTEYFEKASEGLQDFYDLKIRSVSDFTHFVVKYRGFYRSIQEAVSDLDPLHTEIRSSFREFERRYPKAVFPNVYFVMGRYSSNGTISKNGLLIGTEILSRTRETDTTSWNDGLLRLTMNKAHIPVTVAHELVHFNQGRMKKGNSLLWKSIREGSAEFIAEILTGKTDADFTPFRGREEEIWSDFTQEMHESVWTSWQQESEQRPRNAGYWAGYMICKAYSESIGDMDQAISDILSIRDYEEFYQNSNVEEWIQKNFGANP